VYGVATASFDGMEMIDDCMLPVILPNLQAECAFCASIVGKVFMYVWTITLPLLNSKSHRSHLSNFNYLGSPIRPLRILSVCQSLPAL
jgi:hypothetical protein